MKMDCLSLIYFKKSFHGLRAALLWPALTAYQPFCGWILLASMSFACMGVNKKPVDTNALPACVR
jgi:hypothetical protein